jgi:ribosomal protein S18 acetylase RimI-like enzyme
MPFTGLIAAQGLTLAQLDAIDDLAAICNVHDHGALRLNRDVLMTRSATETNDFLYIADDRLVGFLPLFVFSNSETEASGMVHPEYRRRGIFTQLYLAALDRVRAMGETRVLFMVERGSLSGKGFVEMQGGALHHAEYAMTLGAPSPVQVRHPAMETRRAVGEDATAMVRILAEAFGESPDDPAAFARGMAAHPNHHWYVAVENDTVLAVLNAQMTDDAVGIYGFAVTPQAQGRGYGRQMLGQTITMILAERPRRVTLEVATDNEHALALYTSCGFAQTTVYDYYRVELLDPTP